jgi:hypothetical protein
MTNWKLGLVGLAISSLAISALAATTAQAAVLIIHAGVDGNRRPLKNDHQTAGRNA